jgi:hypothetical protein
VVGCPDRLTGRSCARVATTSVARARVSCEVMTGQRWDPVYSETDSGKDGENSMNANSGLYSVDSNLR